MMRVLHIISGLGMGGAENMLWKLLANSPRSRVQADVVSLSAHDALRAHIEATGARVIQINTGSHTDRLRAPLRLMSIARDLRPHLIQGWMNHGNVAASLAGLVCASSPKVIWNIRQSLDRIEAEKRGTRAMIRLGALISQTADALLFNSVVGLEQHVRVGFRNRSMVVVPNGFDTQRFKPDPKRRSMARQSLGIDQHALLLGMVARYHPMKNYPLFLRAVARIRNHDPDVRVLLIGPGMESTNGELMALIRELNLSAHCILLGAIESTERIYPAMDLLCLASGRAEGFPNVIGEAMSCGVVCVATEVGDTGRVVADSGFIVPPNDCEAFSSAILRFRALPFEIKRAMSERARERIVAEYSIGSIVQRYLSIYEQLLVS